MVPSSAKQVSGWPKEETDVLTTSRRVHFAVGAVHDSVHRSVVAFIQLHFVPVDETVDPDPWITNRTGDKTISSRWMQGGGRRRMRKGETMRGSRRWHDRVECDVLSVCQNEGPRWRRKLKRSDRIGKFDRMDWLVAAQIPPAVESTMSRNRQ
jgi:hypothetical protein